MRGLLLAASLVAVRALPTRLRTRANAAETALADTKVDGDRVLPAMQRLDADLEESERRHLRPKTRELERTTAGRIDCKNVITEGMTLVEAYDACSGTKRQGKIVRTNTYQCYFFVKKGVFPFMQRKCSSHLTDKKGQKATRDGWHPWVGKLSPCFCMAKAYRQYRESMMDWWVLEDYQLRLKKSKLVLAVGACTKAYGDSADKIAQCGYGTMPVTDAENVKF